MNIFRVNTVYHFSGISHRYRQRRPVLMESLYDKVGSAG